MSAIAESAALAYMRHCPVDYGKSRLESKIDRVSKPAPLRYTTPADLTYHLDLSDHVMRQIYMKGAYERNTQRHVSRLLKPDMNFFDVGANIGAYSLPVAQKLSSGFVYAFEPNPFALDLLRANISSNVFENIEVVEIGFSDRPGVGQLSTRSLTTASLHHEGISTATVDIELSTIDSFCEQRQIEFVDVMKIDIEGHEMAALTGGDELLSRSKKMVLIVEIDDNCEKAGHSRHDLFRQIVDHGFKAFLPRAWPKKLQEVDVVAPTYTDNVVFLKGYE